MLAANAACLKEPENQSNQNWFQRTNRFANKVFGSLEKSLGPCASWVGDFSLFEVPLKHLKDAGQRAVEPEHEALAEFATRVRSGPFVEAEELNGPDVELERLDELYRRVGLRRFRRVLGVASEKKDALAGLVLAYRGPLGLNFSFLENRCDLLVDPDLPTDEVQRVCAKLLAAAAPIYEDFELRSIPVVIDLRHAGHVRAVGGRYVRYYAQGLGLREGYERWYRHTERFYEKISGLRRATA
jgi:hypothetical protein